MHSSGYQSCTIHHNGSYDGELLITNEHSNKPIGTKGEIRYSTVALLAVYDHMHECDTPMSHRGSSPHDRYGAELPLKGYTQEGNVVTLFHIPTTDKCEIDLDADMSPSICVSAEDICSFVEGIIAEKISSKIENEDDEGNGLAPEKLMEIAKLLGITFDSICEEL